jgi:hypothetical protein
MKARMFMVTTVIPKIGFSKLGKKGKVNPFTFWSILGTLSTLLKSLKNHFKTLQMP